MGDFDAFGVLKKRGEGKKLKARQPKILCLVACKSLDAKNQDHTMNFKCLITEVERI